MASRHLSIRVEPSTLEKLEQESHRGRQTVSELARELLEEGLRMRLNAGIVFRAGPAGRRPALLDGPDVWQIVQAYRSSQEANDEDPEGFVAEVAAIERFQVQDALRYYATYPAEIDLWINEELEEEDRAHAAWLREQQVASR